MSWLWIVERKLVETLLRSPAFHKSVQKVHKQIHHLQHGKPPEYYGGTNLEDPASNGGVKNFVKLFWEELKSGHKPEPPKKK